MADPFSSNWRIYEMWEFLFSSKPPLKTEVEENVLASEVLYLQNRTRDLQEDMQSLEEEIETKLSLLREIKLVEAQLTASLRQLEPQASSTSSNALFIPQQIGKVLADLDEELMIEIGLLAPDQTIPLGTAKHDQA